jgi:hypothetical protein
MLSVLAIPICAIASGASATTVTSYKTATSSIYTASSITKNSTDSIAKLIPNRVCSS